MGELTPAQKLADIRKTIAAAKREEDKTIWELPKEDRHRDWEIRRGRILRGSTEVTVDYELNKDDLESLGYHHEDDCAGSYDDAEVPDPEANRRRLSDWHDHAHGLSLWASCVYEPCNLLTDEFRSTP